MEKSDGDNDNGFGVEFDSEHGVVTLVCRPDAFRLFKEFVVQQLGNDFPDVQMEKVYEIEILNESAPPRVHSKLKDSLIGIGCLAVVGSIAILAFTGFVTIVNRINHIRGH